jgi:hypothetical protein
MPLMDLGDKDTAAIPADQSGGQQPRASGMPGARPGGVCPGRPGGGRRALVSRATRATMESMNQGVKLAREGKLDEAINLTREARERMPNNPRLLLNHAFLLIAWMEQYGRDVRIALEARSCIEAARRLKPSDKRAGELLTKLELVGNDFGG